MTTVLNVKCTQCKKAKPIEFVTKKGKPYCETCAPAMIAQIERLTKKPVSAIVATSTEEEAQALQNAYDPEILEAEQAPKEESAEPEEISEYAKQENARERLKALYEERNAIREHYYAQKNALRGKRKELGDIDYYDHLNALKQAYSEQCDRVFDAIRSCKVMIEATEQMIDDMTFVDPEYVEAEAIAE